MKPMKLAQDVLPIAKFKSQASAVLRKLRKDKRPIVITQNGLPAGVVITPEAYDLLLERERFIEQVNRGLRDSEADRVTDDSRLGAELEAEFGSLSPK